MAGQRYTVLEKIESGGMAEVWKGRSSSLEGFDKNVAIKRVLPNLAQNKQFMSMFLDEARLSLHLNHANIVQTFDIGVSDNTYFIVMEWVDGANLKTICETALNQGFRIPREQAVFIAVEMCKGLSHAHNRRDADGHDMGIVHRDVSPPNVLISREGEVKLVDFGLAKAVTQLTSTDPGVIKGKFGYLSPEAANGKVVDFRADIFAVGIILWEMLTGQRLFEGKSNLETVKLVRAAQIPSISKLNPDVEPQLEALVRRTLSVDPADRFQSSEQLGHELSRYLFTNQLLVTSYDLAVLVKRVLAERALTMPMRRVTPELMANAEQMQGELGGFVSLEELERMSFVSVSASQSNLDAADKDIEDPRSWAGEFKLDPNDESADETLISSDFDLRKLPPSSTQSPSSGLDASVDDEVTELSMRPEYVSAALVPPRAVPADDDPESQRPRRHTIPAGHFEPIIERVSDESVAPGSMNAERVSLMDFAAPPPSASKPPPPPTRIVDGSIIRGVLAGLAGAGLIIYLTWRFLIN